MAIEMTNREREVARELCNPGPDGRLPTMLEVSNRLGVSLATAKAHLRSIARKLPNPHGLPAQRLVRSLAPVVRTVTIHRQR
jgi:ATP/maltotriose-dependent transcriptional regulator MalT